MGLFISLESSTRDMRQEEASAGFYHSDLWARDFAKIQLRTLGEMLSGNWVRPAAAAGGLIAGATGAAFAGATGDAGGDWRSGRALRVSVIRHGRYER